MPIESLLARSVQIFVALLGAYVVVLWFVSIVWTYRDIEARSRNIFTQISATLLAMLFPFMGIPLYLVLRPKETLDAAYQKSLEEEYLLQDLEELPLCPTCQRFVADDFIICPHCQTRLREACPSCGRLVDLRWALCPYCGAERDERGMVPAASSPEQIGTSVAERRPAPAAREGAAAAVPGPLGHPVGNGTGRRVVLSVVGDRQRGSADEASQPRPEPGHTTVSHQRRFLRPGVDFPLKKADQESDRKENGGIAANDNHRSGQVPLPTRAERD
jgi:RNA polymerase subunit RPABC4/transcription elongation factor Spt4